MAESESDLRADDSLFRTEAIEYHRRPSDDEGRLLRVTPLWLNGLYRLLMGSGIAVGALVLMVPAGEYASGPAIVRLAERSEVNAETAGLVEEILVAPGDRVKADQLLARLESSRQEAELEKRRRELELLLIERLRAPRGASRSRLGAAHEEVRLAEKGLKRLELRAPHEGVIGDVLLRPGKAVEPGQLAFTVISPEARGEPTVIGLLPGRYRPLLEPGMPMQLRLSGYRAARQELTIEHVSASVVSAAEVRALAGPIAGGGPGGLGGAGGFVLVQARLPSTYFEAAGRRYEYHDGLPGMAEVPVRKRTLASLLLPGSGASQEGR